MHARLIAIPCLAALGLAACAPQAAGPASSRNPVYATDIVGKAGSCTAPDVALTQGKESVATLATSGGGWCGIPVTLGGNAVTAGLLTQRPQHGHVYVHTVGDVTRVDYLPLTKTVTADAFTVTFLPGDEMMRVTVSAAVTK